MIVTISLFKSIIFTTPNRTIFFEHYAITNCILYICIQRASAAEMAAAVRGDKEQDEKNIMEDQEDCTIMCTSQTLSYRVGDDKMNFTRFFF